MLHCDKIVAVCPPAKTSAMAVTSSSFPIGSDPRDLCCTVWMLLEAVGRSAAAHKSPDRYPYCTASVGKKGPNMQSSLCIHRGLFLSWKLSRHDSAPFTDIFSAFGRNQLQVPCSYLLLHVWLLHRFLIEPVIWRSIIELRCSSPNSHRRISSKSNGNESWV